MKGSTVADSETPPLRIRILFSGHRSTSRIITDVSYSDSDQCITGARMLLTPGDYSYAIAIKTLAASHVLHDSARTDMGETCLTTRAARGRQFTPSPCYWRPLNNLCNDRENKCGAIPSHRIHIGHPYPEHRSVGRWAHTLDPLRLRRVHEIVKRLGHTCPHLYVRLKVSVAGRTNGFDSSVLRLY